MRTTAGAAISASEHVTVPLPESTTTKRADASVAGSDGATHLPRGQRARRRVRRSWWLSWMVFGGVAAATGRWLRRPRGWITTLVALWLIVSAVLLVMAKRDADRGLDELRAVQAELAPADLLRGEGHERFETARRAFAAAHAKATSPLLAPWRVVPFVGRQVRTVGSMTGAAEDIVRVGGRALDSTAAEMTAADAADGAARIELARRLGAIAALASAELDGVRVGPGHLIGPLQRARDRLDRELERLRATVADAAVAGDGLADFLQGPTRYLVFAANNAEMRQGSGAFLSAGVMLVRDGKFELGEMEPTEDLLLEEGDVPIRDADYAREWGFAEPTTDFRELATTTRFDVVAAHALEMWQERKGERLDGVLVLDPIALRALLKVTGPVEVEGEVYDAGNVVFEIFLDQYELVEVGAPGQTFRRDVLSKIARAAIAELEAGGWDTIDLIDALRPVVRGRHILGWSPDGGQQAGWRGIGIDGALEPDSIALGLQNRAGNKLDQFVEVDAVLRGEAEGDRDRMTIDVTLRNVAPEELPGYVEGPYFGTPRAAAGKYQGWLVVELPAFARNNRIDVEGRQVPQVVSGRSGPGQRVVGVLVEFERGTELHATVHFDLPDGMEAVTIAPSARVPVVRWKSGSGDFGDSSGRRVELADIIRE